MFNWDVKEYTLMNDKQFASKNETFACEDKLSVTDKIEFLDRQHDGLATYLINLVSKFEEDKSKLKWDSDGINARSFKSWVKRNDPRGRAEAHCRIGLFSFNGMDRFLTMANERSGKDVHKDMVDEMFRRELLRLLELEKNHFREHDPYEVKLTMLIDGLNGGQPYFDVDFSIHFGGCEGRRVTIDNRDVTLEEIEFMLSKWKQVDDYIKSLSAEVKERFGVGELHEPHNTTTLK